jgi:hypothetical protein
MAPRSHGEGPRHATLRTAALGAMEGRARSSPPVSSGTARNTAPRRPGSHGGAGRTPATPRHALRSAIRAREKPAMAKWWRTPSLRRSLSDFFGFRPGGAPGHRRSRPRSAQWSRGPTSRTPDRLGGAPGAGGMASEAMGCALGSHLGASVAAEDGRNVRGTGDLRGGATASAAVRGPAEEVLVRALGSRGEHFRFLPNVGCNCRTALRAWLAELASQLNQALGLSQEEPGPGTPWEAGHAGAISCGGCYPRRSRRIATLRRAP